MCLAVVLAPFFEMFAGLSAPKYPEPIAAYTVRSYGSRAVCFFRWPRRRVNVADGANQYGEADVRITAYRSGSHSCPQNDFVSVTIVTYNSGRFIKRCLESVLAQTVRRTKKSSSSTMPRRDGTVDILEQFEDRCQVVYNEENIGFAAAQNQAIRLSSGDWVLTLNPDVLLLPNFIQALVDAGQIDPAVGTVCGKLLTMTRHLRHPATSRWWIPPAFTSLRCCDTWTAAARKWTTATI